MKNYIIMLLFVYLTHITYAQTVPACESCKINGVEVGFVPQPCKTFTPLNMNCTITVCYSKRVCNGIQEIKVTSIKSTCDNYDLVFIYRLAFSQMWRDDDPWGILPDNPGEQITLKIYSKCCWNWDVKCYPDLIEQYGWGMSPCENSGCCIQTFKKIFYSEDPSGCCHFVAIGVDEQCIGTEGVACKNSGCGPINGQGELYNYNCIYVCGWLESTKADKPGSIRINCGNIKVTK